MGGVLGDWQADPGVWGALLLSGALYAWGVRRARRWPARRDVAFACGLAVIALALLSGLDAEAQRGLAAHMVQHLLLVGVAAPLLLAGAPVALALRAWPGVRAPLGRALRSRTAAVAMHPATGLAVFVVVLAGTHVPAVYEAALEHPAVHALEHLAYLGSALLFWSPVLAAGPLPHRSSPLARLLVVLLAMPPMALAGIAIMTHRSVLYPAYAEARPAPGAALADQRRGGRVMWIGGTIPLGLLAVGLTVRAIDAEERRQARREALADRRAARGGAARGGAA
jgi:cytochrome c oxidase assembly factor CtaG